jgi:predicted LPLAT superfamily acyltransferase
MSAWQGKSKGTSAGYRIFVFLIRTAGKKGAYVLLRFVAFYYFLFSPKSTRPVLNFYRNRLGMGKFKSLKMIYSNYYRLGQCLIDKIALMTEADTDYTFDFDGEHHLREMVKQGRGGILLSGHLGNWEAAGHLLKRLGTRINVVMFDGEDARIKEYMDEVTGQKKFKIIYIRPDLSHIYEMTHALQQNELVCMHADRFLPGNKTVSVPFFSSEARFPEGPFLLALKLKAPVAFVFAFKESDKHYHFYSSELKTFDSRSGDTVHSVARSFATQLESMTRLYPAQWFNYYDFWKA